MNERERLNAPNGGYLEHYGVKGQKWGVIRSRDELGYERTPKKKKSGVIASIRQSQQQKKKAKLKAKAQAEAKKLKEAAKKAAEEAEKKAAQDAETREKLLKAGNKDSKLLYENRALLSDKELEERLKRINTENALKKVIDSQPTSYDKAMKAIKKVSGTMDDIYKVWDSSSMKAIRKMLGGTNEGSSNQGNQNNRNNSDNDRINRLRNAPINRRELIRNMDSLSTDEMNAVIQRMNAERTLMNQLNERERERGRRIQEEIDRLFS